MNILIDTYTVRELETIVSEYKTILIKKSFLTKEINALKELYKAERNIAIVEKFKRENLG